MPWTATPLATRPAGHGRRPAFAGLGVVVAIVLVLTGCIGAPDGVDGTPVVEPRTYEPPAPAPPLDGLVDTAGRPFSWAELRGRAVLVSFGYTHCPDVCPTTLAIGREVLRARPETAVVFVTVDPKRDTTSALANYLALFAAPIVGLTGTTEAVTEVTKAWGVTVVFGEPDAAGNYPVIHSAGTYVVDPDGRLRFLYPYGTRADVLTGVVDRLASRP